MENETIREVAKFGTRALESGEQLGGFLVRIFGTVPEDLIGILGGDWLRQVRIRNADRLFKRTQQILEERSVKTEPMSPSVALPLLEAAQDESREDLRELWARMLANGMDKSRSHLVRQQFISLLKKLEPLDAVILKRATLPEGSRFSKLSELRIEIGASIDEFEVALQNLQAVGCLTNPSFRNDLTVKTTLSICSTFLGREFLRSCEHLPAH